MTEDYSSNSDIDIDNDPATNPKNKNKEIDPAKNNAIYDDLLNDSLSDSIDNDKKSNKSGSYKSGSYKSGSNKSGSGKSGSNEEDEKEEDKKRNEVRKEFTLEFEKKIAKYIPPKIKFKGDLRKKSLVTMKTLEDKYASGLTIFKKYFLYTATHTLKILNKNLKLIFSEKIVQDDNEIFNIINLNDETIVMIASDKVRIINLNEQKDDVFTYEIVQEIKETKFYFIGQQLNNGYLLIGSGDRKYFFYELEKTNLKFSKDNKYKLIGSVELVHNVYDDDFPDCLDFNNGRLLSWLNDDHNIKVIEYFPEQKIIVSKNGYQLHDAGLICDKYAILMGLTYPQYDSWLMDTESYDIVKHWITPQNDSFIRSFFPNTFFYSSTSRIAYDEFYVKDGEFYRKNIYECYYKEDKKESWDERISVYNALDEYTFITKTWNEKIMIYKCGK